MGNRRAGPALPAADLLELRVPVQRYLTRHTDDPHELEDLTQETLARVWEVRRRIDRSVAISYAVATARNLVLSERRREVVHGRHRHRLLDLSAGPEPEQSLLSNEERRAAAEALLALDDSDRQVLQTHYLTTGPTITDQEARADYAPSPVPRGPGVTSRLARARARARVSYLLALRHLDLPTPRCRGVLDALSAGDRRLQERLGTAAHLLECRTCADCAPALLGRRRVLFGLLPTPFLLLLDPLRRAYQQAPRTTVATGAAVGLVVAIGSASALAPGAASVSASGTSAAAPPAPVVSAAVTDPATPTAASQVPAPAVGAADKAVVARGGQRIPAGRWGSGDVTSGPTSAVVSATAAPVQSVPADEGFWVGVGEQRFWVQLSTVRESPQHVVAGDLVTFTGLTTPFTSSSAPGLTEQEGRGQLAREGGYVAVDPARLRVQPPPH